MSAPRLLPLKKALLVLIGITASVLVLELALRLMNRGPKWVNQDYVEISRGLPELDQLLEERESGTHPHYYDEFLYAAHPQSTATVTFTDYYSARLTPASVSLSEAERIVWAFGGSTMENTETTDELSIANIWSQIFNREMGPTHVKNFGTGSFFSSYELIKFQKLLREVPERDHPALAVFYDGYNDTLHGFQYGPGSLQKDLSLKLQALVEHDDLRIAAYTVSRWLSKQSMLWDRSGRRLVEALLFPLPEPLADGNALAATVQMYVRNARMIEASCAVFDIRCFFILQPLVVTKEPLAPLEQAVYDGMEGHARFGRAGIEFVRGFYREVAEEMKDNRNFIDASGILNGREEADFYDLGHTGALTAPVIGEETARLMLARLGPAPATAATETSD